MALRRSSCRSAAERLAREVQQCSRGVREGHGYFADGAYGSIHNVNDETSLTKIRLPEIVGCVHVSLSATL